MLKHHCRVFCLLGLALTSLSPALAEEVEVFAKGSVSKNYLSSSSYTVAVSATTGIAVTLIPQLRVEFRYANNSSLQNNLQIASNTVNVTLSDIKTETTIYSLGIDVDLLGEKYAVRPFIFVGVGYIETQRSYYYQVESGDVPFYHQDPKQLGLSGNVGAGIRIRVHRSCALELELFAYGMNIHQPNPLVNLYGTMGIRLFI